MMSVYLLLLCSTLTFACRSQQEIELLKKKPKYFSSNSWGGWTPSDDTWKAWIEMFGKENSLVAFDSTEVGRDPESGWPRYWKGMGKGNEGVPPPPWSYANYNYGRPSYCFLQPAKGRCENFTSRFGFNPTADRCQKFVYSGCGANQNNFLNYHDCQQACGRVPETGCLAAKIDFRDYVEVDDKLPTGRPRFTINYEEQHPTGIDVDTTTTNIP